MRRQGVGVDVVITHISLLKQLPRAMHPAAPQLPGPHPPGTWHGQSFPDGVLLASLCASNFQTSTQSVLAFLPSCTSRRSPVLPTHTHKHPSAQAAASATPCHPVGSWPPLPAQGQPPLRRRPALSQALAEQIHFRKAMDLCRPVPLRNRESLAVRT